MIIAADNMIRPESHLEQVRAYQDRVRATPGLETVTMNRFGSPYFSRIDCGADSEEAGANSPPAARWTVSIFSGGTPAISPEPSATSISWWSVRIAIAMRTNTTWPAGIEEVYPKTVPPLRDDRDTVVIGAGQMQGPKSC